MLTVEDIMSRDPKTVAASDTLLEVRTLMSANDIRHLPVLDENGKLTGIVSHRDLLAATTSVLDGSSLEDVLAWERSVRVDEVMSTPVSSATPETDLLDAALHVRKTRHGALPVVDGDQLVGIVTDSDFVEVAIHLLEQMAETEPLPEDDDL